MWRLAAAFVLVVSSSAAAQEAAAPAAQPPDDSNVAARFIRDVAGDYKNFFSLDTAQVLGVGGFAALAVHAADDEIAANVQSSNPPTLTGGYQYGSQYYQIPAAIAWWTIAAIAGSDEDAATGRDLLRAQLSVVGWTYAIKLSTNRTRPNGDTHSFPSGHASTSFATAEVLQEHYGWKVGLPAFILASYTGMSRILANDHFASDVVFGAAVGIASARTVTIKMREARVSVAPLAVPGGGGVLVTAVGFP